MTSMTNQPLAVVPIFVNAGTALLPAILAGLVSVVALLFKPRELLQACRRRPAVPVLILLGGAGIWLSCTWLLGGAQSTARARVSANDPAHADWAKVALRIIKRQQGGVATIPSIAPESAGAAHTPAVFRYNFARCGYAGGPAPLNLKPAWTYNPDSAMLLSSPLVVGDRVYAATALQDITGQTLGAVFCLELATGKPLWRTEEIDGQPLKPFFSSPALTADGKYLLIGQGLHFDADCALLCFETQTGKLHWRLQTPLHIEGSPAIHNDLVVAGAGAIEDENHKPKTDPGFVLAVRISDGKELWRYRVSDPESSPAISPDGIVYIGSGFQGNAVVALRSESDETLQQKKLSRELWRTPLPYPITGAVTLVDDLVIVGGGNGDYITSAPNPAGIVAALDARTGQVRWRTHVEDSVLGSIAADDGTLIAPSCNGEVIALNLSDGAIRWRQPVSGRSPIAAGPALAQAYVYAVSKDGYLAIIDRQNGKLLERHMLNDEAMPGEMGLSLSSPLVSAGCVFVGSETGGLRCFGVKEGAK